jgi:hypothetical protein
VANVKDKVGGSMQVGDLVKYKRSYQNIPIYGIVIRLGLASTNCELWILGTNDKAWKYINELEVIK